MLIFWVSDLNSQIPEELIGRKKRNWTSKIQISNFTFSTSEFCHKKRTKMDHKTNKADH